MDNLLYIVNVEAAIYKNDKWLIIKRSEKEEHAPGLLSMVGGKVETKISENNVLEETLIREIMEEVGIQVSKTLHYVDSKSFISDKGQIVIDIVFLCKYKSGEPKCMSADEVSEIYWMSKAEILENKNTPIWLKESIEKVESIRLKIEKKNV
ncbi:NUDIX domain-containing protein [Proteiniborus sp. MB09-C3]|uniref:NUDIX hydrolase n=1 Tax=Proteiniborus sp. MB09-C3 TaxID=3050072 RepID=UPI0025530D1B|nr:NUDIX domain-containing protein [Proteiniborus sp. MB09-C3]WIV11045.1 NUDIX domain-containing protein [Proteiniborus sp. MB09-C3]